MFRVADALRSGVDGATDRLRPGLGVSMGWRHVLFANWPVDPGVVAAHLPADLSVDTHEGRAWLSVVPFTNVAVRPPWLPRAAGFDLPELNLRTYVTHGDQSGVYFFSLDADGLLGVVGARLFHHLPYYRARIALSASDDGVGFACRRRHPGARPVELGAAYGPEGDRFHAEPGSLAAFLVDRDRYYTQAPDGSLRYATVDHERWPLYDTTPTIDADDLFRANGFAPPEGDPVHLYSPGVDTIASGSKRIDGG